MTTILLTFLGRVPKTEKGAYRKTCYQFEDGSTEPLAFFGWALQQRLQPQRLVILGTAGSMWEHLFEGDLDLGGREEEARLALVDAVGNKNVTDKHLSPLAPLLSDRLGCEVRLQLIPYCRDEREQVELLSVMSGHVESRDQVHIDVTHGFRHLPMLALLATFYLRSVRQAEIEGIWYGAFDPDSGAAPVHNLLGLLRIADWLEALHTYDKDGDYGVFAPLLGPVGEWLRSAAFFERSSNPVKARQALTSWSKRSDRFPLKDPAAELFRDQLDRRVSWYRGPDRAAWEKSLAWQYLGQGDYVRAAIYGLEAVITREVIRRGGDPGDYDRRDGVREELKQSQNGFKTLQNLRNALAHGVRPFNQKIEKAMANEADLRHTLGSLLTQLVGKLG